jgi:hypothetical protein
MKKSYFLHVFEKIFSVNDYNSLRFNDSNYPVFSSLFSSSISSIFFVRMYPSQRLQVPNFQNKISACEVLFTPAFTGDFPDCLIWRLKLSNLAIPFPTHKNVYSI